MNDLSEIHPQTNRILALADDVAEIAARIPEAGAEIRPDRGEIAALAAFIAQAFRPERIILFGSRAYGTPTKDSDVDLLVVMDTPGRPVEQAVRIRQSLPLPRPFPLDIMVRTPDRIALGLAEGDFFIRDVMTQGVTLFEAGGAAMAGQG